MVTKFVHSGPGNVEAFISGDNEAVAVLTLPNGEVKRFTQAINPNTEDPFETLRKTHSQALQAHLEHEEQVTRERKQQEQAALLVAAFGAADSEAFKDFAKLVYETGRELVEGSK